MKVTGCSSAVTTGEAKMGAIPSEGEDKIEIFAREDYGKGNCSLEFPEYD